MGEVDETFFVAGGKAAPRAARQLVHRCAEPVLAPGALADVDLLVSEIVSNAVRHGGGDGDSTLVIELSVSDGRARVSVSDPGVGFDPDDLPSRRPDVGGNGLLLVKALATRWGVEKKSDRFCVWFER